ncbi:MAG: ATP-binding protein [Eubacteriales bacterium]|nr:ATP-binding protein [Eubacteriales bacterium]
MRETRNLEYKESISNTFLKTVSAFANFGTGCIQFGIKDDGTEIGINNPKQACLDIENRINDSLDPSPNYTLHINTKNSVITLCVEEGIHKPYFYKSKAYKRNDSATAEVDRLELTRLILEGQNIYFEEQAAGNQDLSFTLLNERLMDKLHLESVTKDTYRTLELSTEKNGYNIAGELLADVNGFPGIDMVRFGDSINTLLDRKTHVHVSILKQYDSAIDMYRQYYQFEQIKGSIREKREMIPEEAFREAVANAIVHRTWDVNADITVSMFPNRIEIVSPGGLPKGLSKEAYLTGGISILRNRIIGNVFLRLQMIERFGTGIRRINEAYINNEKKPVYDILPDLIKITLPVIGGKKDLMQDENQIYFILKGKRLSSSAIVEATGFGKTKVVSILNKLVAEGYVYTAGNGRGRVYFVE